MSVSTMFEWMKDRVILDTGCSKKFGYNIFYCVCNRRKSEQRLGTSMAVMQADLFAIDNGPVQAAEIKDLPRATVSALGRCDKAENGVELRDELGFARVI